MSEEASEWVIYACRTPYALEVAEIIWRRRERIAFLVDNLEAPDPVDDADPHDSIGAPTVGPHHVAQRIRDYPVVVPLITPGHRYSVEAELRRSGVTTFPPLVDPTAVVARTASIAEGSVINASATIGAGVDIGRFVHVNRSASVGHHGTLADYATLGPGCVLAGHVRVESGAFIGAGAVCGPGVTVGSNALVGAGAVVMADVPARSVVAGNPARVLRSGGEGYGGASVPV